VPGSRVGLAGCEAQLVAHPAVRQAVVAAGPDAVLQAFLVLRGALHREDIQAFLGERLPDHMLPGRYFEVAAVPVTDNGKVDRAALLAGGATELAAAKDYEAPRHPDEMALAAIWREVLQRDRIGMADNFFELGGHSLKATQAVSRIRQRLERDVRLKDFFGAQTFAALCAVVASRPA